MECAIHEWHVPDTESSVTQYEVWLCTAWAGLRYGPLSDTEEQSKLFVIFVVYQTL